MRKENKPWFIRENPHMQEVCTKETIQRRYTENQREKQRYEEAVRKIRRNKTKN